MASVSKTPSQVENWRKTLGNLSSIGMEMKGFREEAQEMQHSENQRVFGEQRNNRRERLIRRLKRRDLCVLFSKGWPRKG